MGEFGIGHVAIGGGHHHHEIDQCFVRGRLCQNELPMLSLVDAKWDCEARRAIAAMRKRIEGRALRRRFRLAHGGINAVPTDLRLDSSGSLSISTVCAGPSGETGNAMPQTRAPLITPEILDAARSSKAWPFEEAQKVIDRYKGTEFPETVLFETGYGPSGLPHIGTFGEVARTSMVRHAFRVLTEDKVKTRLLCFSDDMDGMRKIPDNVPDRAFLEPYLHMPLTAVPNPFGGDHDSFGHHNNAML
ncbi:MAG: hypothetical protein Q8Q62_13080, partial [Mesorhizobium sp.]|nr:hypothetical protein [Mesorhizobium sp.]